MISLINKKIFGKEYNVFNESCCSKSNKRTLYIELLNTCNARCSFCSAGINSITKEKYVDLKKLKIVLDELINNDIIDKISLTGGEPLLFPQLKELLELLDSYNKLNFYAITTNGKLLKDKLELLEKSKVKYINISRHHYLDEKNNYIFKSIMPSFEEIGEIINSSNKEFRINITITDNINNILDIEQFINKCNILGVKNILFRKDYLSNDENLLIGIEKLMNTPDYLKQSNKCKCYVKNINGVNIEFRIVDVEKEKRLEKDNKFIRNLIYTCNNELQGGWSSKSIKLY